MTNGGRLRQRRRSTRGRNVRHKRHEQLTYGQEKLRTEQIHNGVSKDSQNFVVIDTKIMKTMEYGLNYCNLLYV